MIEVLPPRTRVVKVGSQPGDLTPDGAQGTIVDRIGPFRDSPGSEVKLGYVVLWDSMPGMVVGIAHYRVQRLEPIRDPRDTH